jgi:hypothetical protein
MQIRETTGRPTPAQEARMIRLRPLSLLLAPLLVALLGGCASSRSPGSMAGRDPRVLTGEEIQASGARSAWEALRTGFPQLRLWEDRSGRPARMDRRGPSSVLLEDRPSIFIDGARIADFRQLHQVPAMEIALIRLLNGIDGTTRYGTNSGDGVILIETRGASLPLR